VSTSFPLGNEETATVVVAIPAALTGDTAKTVDPRLKVTDPVAFGGPALEDCTAAVNVRLPPVTYHADGVN
jgi:hypothetical protein